MSSKLFISSIYLTTLIFIFLLNCEAQIRCRMLPHNGGMFGFVSDPSLCQEFGQGISDNQEIEIKKRVDRDIEHGVEVREHVDSALENLAFEMKKVEPLIRASIDQCSQIEKSSGSLQDPILAILCSGLDIKERNSKSWLKQLLGID